MKREIIKIDEEKCNGCGLCIPNCHEGALQIIDGKARLISDLMCDGLGACLGHCPEGAMEIEMREAMPYDEVRVMEEMVKKGRNTVTAHMKHLKDHGEFIFLKQAAEYLMNKAESADFPVKDVIQEVHSHNPRKEAHESAASGSEPEPATASVNKQESIAAETSGVKTGQAYQGAALATAHNGHGPAHHAPASDAGHSHNGGCPGSRSMSFAAPVRNGAAGTKMVEPGGSNNAQGEKTSQLTQWPVQMHLINPGASHFRGSDLLMAADCVAYSMGNFHDGFLKGKTLAIACPKLDSNKEVYLEKMVRLINDARINTVTVMKMEVPCCSGIEQIVMKAMQSANRKVPVKSITVGIRGNILAEEWI